MASLPGACYLFKKYNTQLSFQRTHVVFPAHRIFPKHIIRLRAPVQRPQLAGVCHPDWYSFITITDYQHIVTDR